VRWVGWGKHAFSFWLASRRRRFRRSEFSELQNWKNFPFKFKRKNRARKNQKSVGKFFCFGTQTSSKFAGGSGAPKSSLPFKKGSNFAI
jgi:hypothetical protein